MDLYKLLILQLIAHFLSDYFFQSPKWSMGKDKEGFRSGYLYKHTLVTFLFSAVFSFQFSFIIFSVLISLIHFTFDGLKKYFSKLSFISAYVFFIDQFFHLLTIFLVVILYNQLFVVEFLIDMPKINYLLIIFAFVLILKPTNIFIREIFILYDIKLEKTESEGDELPNAGKLIGLIERVLTLTLIILGEFSAIGLILAAKSILRYKDTTGQKAEYVLIGTMLSFGIAIVIGVILKMVNESL